MSELKITSIEELKKMAEGEIIELPGFTEESPFVARLKRPSMLNMVRAGKIPNELLIEANKLFSSGPAGVANSNSLDPNMMNELFNIMEIICEEAFVEPRYKDIVDAGLTLTDQQLIAIFSYTQNGIEALKPFRK